MPIHLDPVKNINVLLLKENDIQDQPNTFFLENALKKNYRIFSYTSLLFESTILPVNNGK